MCGRFIDPNLCGTETELSEIKIQPLPRRYNVKPTQDVLILVTDAHEPMMARWWLVPSWHKGDLKDWKATTFNARIEDAVTKPTFRGPWRYGRCLIPVAGYYEWTGEKGSKQPYVIVSAGNAETLYFAGLASRWREILTCTIVTRGAIPSVADVHSRMPVILDPVEREAWLAGSDDIVDLGTGALLEHHRVRPFGIADDGPELIEPAPA